MKRNPIPDARKAPAAAAPERATAPGGEPDLSLTAYDALGDTERFDEPVRGLQIRELLAPGIFRRFFGAPGAAGAP